MKFRFTIKRLMVVTALVAIFTGIFAPELRAWNRDSFLLLSAVGVGTLVVLISFTPVWLVLYWLRKRARRGSGTRATDYAVVFVALIVSLGLMVGIIAAIMLALGR